MDITLHLNALSLNQTVELPPLPKWHDDVWAMRGDSLPGVKATLGFIKEWDSWADECEDLIWICAYQIAETVISNEWAEQHFTRLLELLEAYPIRPFTRLTKESVMDMMREYETVLGEYVYLTWSNWCAWPFWLHATMCNVIERGTRKMTSSSVAVQAASSEFGVSALSLSPYRPTAADVPALLQAKLGAQRVGGRDKVKERREILKLLKQIFPEGDEQWAYMPLADQVDEQDVTELTEDVDRMVI